jgi:hypothetical protein
MLWTLMGVKAQPLIDRMIRRTWIENLHECWNWWGGTNSWGYGSVAVSRTESRKAAHRVMYQMVYGVELSTDVLLHHVCENTRCINPLHLEEVSVLDHNRIHRPFDWIADFHRSKTHCPHGHEYSPENTRIGSKGGRLCFTCKGEWQRRYRARKKAGLV